MAEYKNYLAARILSEDQVVTYRLLSRALKVNVNEAKEMLWEFHHLQNGKKPGTIHATYLVSGTKRKAEPLTTNGKPKKDGEDEYIHSSPFMSSLDPQAEEQTGESSVLSISLTREEDLDNLRSQYEHIASIHIYSLGPNRLKDLQVLSDATRELQELCAAEDPLEFGPKYGTIINKNVKRRAARRPLPKPSLQTEVPAKQEGPKLSAPTTSIKREAKSSQPSSANEFFGKSKEKAKTVATSNPSSTEPTLKPPALKRDPSSILKSFAKAKPKLKREGTDSSVAESPPISAVEDEPMKDVSDDEVETYVPPPQPVSNDITDSDRKSRKEREAALKKMMEDDDEEEEEHESLTPTEPEPMDEAKSDEESVERKDDPIVTTGGRRRGRRRVMKKKTVKDEEGYLVTKEEAVWESYSEDEPMAQKPKLQPSSAGAKSKKPAAKAGQGSIMSFFGKK